MSNEKFSPQLLRSVLESEGIDIDTDDTNDIHGSLRPPNYPLIRTLDTLERKKALKQLSLLISQFRSTSGGADEIAVFRLEELSNVLQLLVELVAETKASEKNREEKKKLLHVAAAILRRMLHMPDASHYRILGLNNGAASAQIEKHHQLLHELFWFDETIDPRRKSRLRISEAYAVLKDPESRRQYNKYWAQIERQSSRAIRGGWKNAPLRFAVVALLAMLGLAGTVFYFDKTHDTNVTSTSEEAIQQQPAEEPETELAAADEIPIDAHVEPQLQDSLAKIFKDGFSAQSGVAESTDQTVIPEQTDNSSAKKNVYREPASRRQDRSGQTSKQASIRGDGVSWGKKMASVEKQRDNVASVSVPLEFESAELEYSNSMEQSGQPVLPAVSTLGNSTSGPGKPTMVVIGSPGLSVDSLTREQVRAIFLGSATRISSGELVTAVARQGGSSAKETFYRDVFGKTLRQFKIHWAKIRFQGKQHQPEYLADDEAVLNRVASSPGMIGVVESTVVDGSVKVLLGPDTE